MLLVAPGITTRNKKLLGTKGIATRSKDATSVSFLDFHWDSRPDFTMLASSSSEGARLERAHTHSSRSNGLLTLPKTNMELENGPLGRLLFSSTPPWFSGSMWVSSRVWRLGHVQNIHWGSKNHLARHITHLARKVTLKRLVLRGSPGRQHRTPRCFRTRAVDGETARQGSHHMVGAKDENGRGCCGVVFETKLALPPLFLGLSPSGLLLSPNHHPAKVTVSGIPSWKPSMQKSVGSLGRKSCLCGSRGFPRSAKAENASRACCAKGIMLRFIEKESIELEWGMVANKQIYIYIYIYIYTGCKLYART